MSCLGSYSGPVHAVIVGASGGIGGALVERLLREETVASLVATARDPDRIAPAVEDPRLDRTRLDLLCESSIASLADDLSKLDRTPNLILVASGLLHRTEPAIAPEKKLADLETRPMLDSYHLNALGPLMVAKHLLPLLSRSERTVFAALSARVGSIGDNRLGGWYHYRMSKAALNMGVKTAAIEAARRCRGAVFVTLHPGTVDTELSKPFQSSVPTERLFSPERAADQLLGVLDRLSAAETGGFFAWDGSAIPW